MLDKVPTVSETTNEQPSQADIFVQGAKRVLLKPMGEALTEPCEGIFCKPSLAEKLNDLEYVVVKSEGELVQEA